MYPLDLFTRENRSWIPSGALLKEATDHLEGLEESVQKVTAYLSVADHFDRESHNSLGYAEKSPQQLCIERLDATIEKTKKLIYDKAIQYLNAKKPVREAFSSLQKLEKVLEEVGPSITDLNLDGLEENGKWGASIAKIDGGTIQKCLRLCPNLIHLSARHCELEDENLATAFDFYPLTFRCAKSIFLPSLKTLDLGHNLLTLWDSPSRKTFTASVTPAGPHLVLIAERFLFPSLEYLGLSGNQIVPSIQEKVKKDLDYVREIDFSSNTLAEKRQKREEAV